MENKQSKNENIISENKGRGLFYVVIAVATFIIMAVGATFAYFTATTNSMNSAVKAGSTTLQLEYISYSTAWMSEELIPANDTVVEYSFEMQNDTTITDPKNLSNTLCRDDYGNAICSVYVFQVENSANSPQSVSIDIVSEENGFESLHAMAYEVAIPTDSGELEIYNNVEPGEDGVANPNGDGDPVFRNGTNASTEGVIDVVDGKGSLINDYNAVYINRKGVVKKLLQWVESTDELTQVQVVKPSINRLLKKVVTAEDMALPIEQRTTRVADNVEIPGDGGIKTFALVLYVKNANKDQTETDADKDFTGQVIVGSGDGSSGVSGKIGLSGDYEDQLQSNKQNQEEETEENRTEQQPEGTE